MTKTHKIILGVVGVTAALGAIVWYRNTEKKNMDLRQALMDAQAKSEAPDASVQNIQAGREIVPNVPFNTMSINAPFFGDAFYSSVKG